MSRSSSAWIVCAVLAASINVAHAQSCETQIARLQAEAARASPRTIGGPTAPQSVGAQLGHQPTPDSVARAEQEAQSLFKVTLARAKALHAEGRNAECLQAVARAKDMLEAN